jgi:hypothetical protein
MMRPSTFLLIARATASVALAIALAAALPVLARAELFAAEVPEVAGSYGDLGETRVGNFDLGADLVAVESVRLRLAWQDVVSPVCAGFHCQHGSAFLIGIREPRAPEDPPPLFDRINSVLPYDGVQELHAELLFASGPLALRPVEGGYEIVLDPSPLDVLGDGRASLAVQLGAATGTLTSAEILVEGTAAPEPSDLGAVALIAVAVLRRSAGAGRARFLDRDLWQSPDAMSASTRRGHESWPRF